MNDSVSSPTAAPALPPSSRREDIRHSRQEMVDLLVEALAERVFPKLSFTLEEFTRATGIKRWGIYEAMKSGQLTGRKRGRNVIFLREDVETFLRALPHAKITDPLDEGE